MSEDPESGKPNWLKDAIQTNELQKKHAWVMACKQRVLDKYFGDPVSPERVMGIKTEVGKLLDENEDISLFIPGNNPSVGRIEVHFSRHKEVVQGVEETKDEIEISREWPDDGPHNGHGMRILHNDDRFIMLGNVHKLDHPQVHIASPELYTKMRQEYLDDCIGNGVTTEEFEEMKFTDFPDPSDPSKTVPGRVSMDFIEREFRENYDDLMALSIIETALQSKGNGFNHTEYLDQLAGQLRHDNLNLGHTYPNNSADTLEKLLITCISLSEINLVLSPRYPQEKFRGSRVNWDSLIRDEKLRMEEALKTNPEIWRTLLTCAAVILPHCYEFREWEANPELPRYRVNLEEIDTNTIKTLKKILKAKI